MHSFLRTLPRRFGRLALAWALLFWVSACSDTSAEGSAAGVSLAGKIVGGKPQGLFFMTRYWIATRSLEKSCYYFTADGHAYQNPTGLGPAELAALPAGQRGTFTVKSADMTITWADKSKSSSTLEDVHADAFNWDMGIFVGVKPFSSPQQLVGTFEGGNSVSFSGGTTAASNTYTFQPDGTYTQSGVLSSQVSSNQSTASTGGTSNGAGRWQLTGWQLRLTNPQGGTSQGVAFPFEMDKAGKVVRFYFQSVAYKRQ
ncbi:hypothetical protein [Hymenobacter pini]|uniref:hypothetical protein n=1 Tax=Hymenobacter pini TaxID=2880879 RepID=UPI001CF398DA|nr:hypothetical protein [Hymenobacter pini]MCA8830914.1 hypothetical protein [Hymenobacter pini]